MRVGTFIGKRVVMSNKHWEGCLRRVDVRRAVAGSDTWFIHVKCPFCRAGGRPCLDAGCPLAVYVLGETRQEWGCVTLFRLVKEKLGIKEGVSLYDDYVSWNAEEDKDARKLLKYIHDGLLRMKTTNRRK